MQLELFCATAIIFFGLIIAMFGKRKIESPVLSANSDAISWTAAHTLLAILALFSFVFGLFTAYWHGNAILASFDDIIFAVWLFTFMLLGMVVQVVTAHYKVSGHLFDVKLEQLLYPILFSVVVFYPIWALAGSSERGLFVIHAAFLNGYFWEGIVSTTTLTSKK